MPRDTKEPQSYGSGQDWVTGKTGQKVNPQASVPPAEHRDFYDSRQEPGTSTEDQGGKISDVQLAENGETGENAEPAGQATGRNDAVTRITSQDGGAKRDSFFKKRDYD